MSSHLFHETNLSVRHDHWRRRDFLRSIAVGGMATLSASRLGLAAEVAKMKQRGTACILLWMQGGPSQFETLDPKPDHQNGGETKAISTNVPGIRVSENLPEIAKVADKLCVFRSLNGKEGSHPRASHLMQTGYIPTASVKYPCIGAHVAKQIGAEETELPNFVRIGRQRNLPKAGLLGVDFDPFSINDPDRPPENTTLPTGENRYRRRLGLLGRLEGEFESQGGRQAVVDHRKLYQKTSRMITSRDMVAFDLSKEPDSVKQGYGDSDFGRGCLMARRLVEKGVSFVEVSAGNWDTHFDNFDRSKQLCEQVDQPFAYLLRDLDQRGMLDKTLVVWVGEFGRTPRVNGRGGRDHFPRAFAGAMAGASIRGGQVIGATDPGGLSIADRPVGVTDFLRTIYQSLEIDPDHENMSSIGRPIRVVDDGEAVSEAFA